MRNLRHWFFRISRIVLFEHDPVERREKAIFISFLVVFAISGQGELWRISDGVKINAIKSDKRHGRNNRDGELPVNNARRAAKKGHR